MNRLFYCFYSSPSCDGDLRKCYESIDRDSFYSSPSCDGDLSPTGNVLQCSRFYSSPSCDGDPRPCGRLSLYPCFYSSPSCDGDLDFLFFRFLIWVSILPRLATGIRDQISYHHPVQFLFFPVLRRGSTLSKKITFPQSFYSSPSCDGDHDGYARPYSLEVSILPRLATGISVPSVESVDGEFLFFPVLRRGSRRSRFRKQSKVFLFFPVLRRGSAVASSCSADSPFLFFPVLRRGSIQFVT